ncbi:DUF6801 domain-containing protein [Actinophytocola sp.]|uniref:DUF6801 domain-containing protein n=1 Tax=Actinophytocola sp. TaxID=1872138 RepID=UPI002ED6489B
MRRMASVGVLAAAGVAVALASPGAAGAQDDTQQVDARLTYQCDTSQALLRVTGTFPGTGTTGEPVQPTGVTLAVTVPPEVLAQLPDAVSATSVVRLDTTVTQGETAASASWGAVQDTPVPLGADTVFTGTVEPEPVTAGEPGEITFAAAGLSVTITGQNADGAPTEPPSVELTCLPADDQTTELAAVSVADVEDPVTPSTEKPEPGLRVGTESVSAAAEPSKVPLECHAIDAPETPKNDPTIPVPNPYPFQSYCAKLTGFTNVAKLNASVLQPGGFINISAGSFIRNCVSTGRFCSFNAVYSNNPRPVDDPPADCSKPPNSTEPTPITKPLPDDHTYPKAPGSFFVFGFMPASGTMQLTQLAPAKVDIWFRGTAGEVTAKIQLSVQLIDACVNGVKVPLGNDCRSASPIDAVLTATPATYSITNGGVLTGKVTIPPFSGCGVGEDLDRLLTELISGPDNFVKMTQSKVCSLGNQVNCPPVTPTPQR